MNVLIFVVTLLMLLALMTYTRLDSYLSSQVFQTIFSYYMENDEREYTNLQALSAYDHINVNKVKKDEKSKPKQKAAGSPRVSIFLWFNKTQREEKPKEWAQTKVLLKNLMSSLYGGQPFFQKSLENNPALLDQLISAVAQTVDALPKDQKPKTAKDLANLKLADPELDQVFYKILQGAHCKPVATTESKAKEEHSLEESQGDSVEENGSEEYRSTKGYCSILDFITGAAHAKVRVYLASREVLNAIFPDSQVVDDIIVERQQLYKQALSAEDSQPLAEQFKEHFSRFKDSAIDDDTLSYDVTKTNPKDYE